MVALSRLTLTSPPMNTGVPVSGYSIGNNSITNVAPTEETPIFTTGSQTSIITSSSSVAPTAPATIIQSRETSITGQHSTVIPPKNVITSSQQTPNNTLLYVILGVGSLAAVSAGVYAYMKRGGHK